MNPPQEREAPPVPPGGEPGAVPGRSGLPNPGRALRGLGSIALILEAIVLLLAIQPIRILEGRISTAQLALLLGSAAGAVLLTGVLRSRWAWWLAAALQAALVAGGLLHWMIGAVGVLFGLVWLYVLYVRHRVLT